MTNKNRLNSNDVQATDMNCQPGSLSFLQIASGNAFIPNENEFIKWIKIISQSIEIKQKNMIIRLVDRAEIHSLNKQFRDQDNPTNVLSFPSSVPVNIEPDYLGDIVICAPVVEQEARDQNKPVAAHWAHMLVHGVLHLKGHDHIQLKEAREMESLEVQILADMGFPNPYI